MLQKISKQAKFIGKKETWAEYVKELYKDENGEAEIDDLVAEVYRISSEDIEAVIKEQSKERPVW